MNLDIATRWDEEQLVADWAIEPPGLAGGEALRTAVLISLFTDRRADDDDALPGDQDDRRGWWADTGQLAANRIGSRLWLLSREKQSNETRLRAEEYAREALAWMLTDAVADQIDVAAAWVAPGRLELTIDIWRAQRRLFQGRYSAAWQEEVARV